jgi:hypothetical protein
VLNFLRPAVGLAPVTEEAEGPSARAKSIPMSWWLSPPVQAYLNGQLCEQGSPEPAWNSVLSLLRKTTAATVPTACPSSAPRYVH